MRTILAVMGKELLEASRDANVLLYALGFPLLLYPMLIWGVVQLLQVEAGVTESQPSRVAMSAPREMLSALAEPPVESLPGGEEDLLADRLDAILELVPQPAGGLVARLTFRSTRARSRRARALLSERLESWRQHYLEDLGTGMGRGAGAFLPWKIEAVDESPAGEVATTVVSRVLAVLLLTVLVLSTLYPLVEVMVGERERGTLETTMVAAVPRLHVVAGKLLAVMLIAMTAVLGNLVALLATLASMLPDLGSTLGPLASRDPLSLFMAFMGLLTMALALAGSMGLVILPARSYKTAQNNGMVLGTVFLGLSALALFPQVEAGPVLALVPAAGTSLLLRDSIAGGVPMSLGTIVVVTNLSVAVVGFWLGSRVLANEGYLFGERLPRWLAWMERRRD